jgi:Uncharacterized protein conserved in bacteria (DUF2194).
MFIVFFMFQFTNVVLESWKGFEENPYARKREELFTKGTAYEMGKEEGEGTGAASREGIIYIGDENGVAGKTVYNWAVYTKRSFNVYGSVAEYDAASVQFPKFLVLDAANIDWQQAGVSASLSEYVKKGVNLIFSSLPEASVIEGNPELKELLGIKQIKETETTVTGLRLLEGFLLGGEARYQTKDKEEAAKRQDMELTFPWYILASDTEVYLQGLPKGNMDEKDYPAVIWENKLPEACVFAVNGRYMEDAAGLGLLSAMSSKVKEYEIYPVVNAQNMVVVNYPSLASENEEEMQKYYGQSMQDVLWNIVWPSIVSVYRKNTLGLSCMMSPQYDYGEDNFPSQANLEFYMKRIKEQSAETGLSGESVSDTPIDQKLREDGSFMKKALPDYKFTSFYRGKLTDVEAESALESEALEAVRTIVADYDGNSEIIGYQSDSITKQSILSDGTRHTYMEDFRLRSIETALGYTSVRMDVSRGAYPKNDEDEMEKVLSNFSWNIRNYWKNFHSFSGTTVSECDQRIRNFLAVKYTQRRENDEIFLDFTSMDTSAWFVLRTNKEVVTHVENGKSRKIEEGAYLIEASDTHVTIELAPAEE